MADMDNAIALGVKPLQLDIATPLLTAAKIRQSQVETQQHEQALKQNAAGEFARGVAVYADKPEFAQKWGEGMDDLKNRGLIDPQSYARMRDNPSPLILKQIIAQTTTPELAFRREEAGRTQANTDRSFGLQERQFAETQKQHEIEASKPVTIGTGLSGDILARRNPNAPGGYEIIDAKALRAAQQPGQPAPQPGGPSPQSGEPAATPAPSAAPAIPQGGQARGGLSPKEIEVDTKAGRNMQYIATLEPDEQKLIKKVADYEINPQSLSTKGGHRERILTAAANYDSNYDQKNYGAYSEGLKKFQSAKEGAAVRSFNVAIEHLEQLGDLGKALNNGDVQAANKLWNAAKTQFGYEGPTNFSGLKQIVGAEIVKAIVGAGGGVSEREEAAKTISAASSPEQLAGIIKTYSKAMGAQLGGLQRQYEQATGRRDFDRLLSPQAIQARDSHSAAQAGGPPPAAGAPVRPSSKAERDALPAGTQYIAPDGSLRTRQ